MVRLDRPSLPDYFFTGERTAIRTSSLRFKNSEPPRTFSNYSLTEIARYRASFHMRSEWFDCTEPSPPTALPGIQGVQGARGPRSMRFKHIEPHRTFSNRCISHPAHLVAPEELSFEEVRYSRTTPTSSERRLYTVLSL